jgi:hypothetical protein
MPDEAEDRVVGGLRELREPLHDGLRKVQVAAGAVSDAEPRMAMAAVETAWQYLEGTFLPACAAEQFSIFLAADAILSKSGSLEVLRLQHDSLRKMITDLGQVVTAMRSANSLEDYARYLLPLLHGLYAAIRVHIESEDDALLPLLDANLSQNQADALCESLQRFIGI